MGQLGLNNKLLYHILQVSSNYRMISFRFSGISFLSVRQINKYKVDRQPKTENRKLYYTIPMRIIGVDPGLGRLGWGVIEALNSRQSPIAYGCIETKKGVLEEKRLEEVYAQLEAVIDELKPDVLAVEKLFFGKNVTTAFMVGQARGIVLLLAAQSGLPVFEYGPGEVKVAVSGYGKADKNQIGSMVKAILKLKELPKLDDTTDALAIALTHAFTAPKVVKIAKR